MTKDSKLSIVSFEILQLLFFVPFELSNFVTPQEGSKEKRVLHQRLRGIRSADGVNPVLADKSPAALTGHAKSPLIRGLISD